MSKSYKHSRPTIGVLAGWQVYHGFVHSYLDSLFRGIRLAAEARDCNLLLACGVTPGLHIIRPAWPVLAADTDFVPLARGTRRVLSSLRRCSPSSGRLTSSN
jgi:hypothetical protein